MKKIIKHFFSRQKKDYSTEFKILGIKFSFQNKFKIMSNLLLSLKESTDKNNLLLSDLKDSLNNSYNLLTNINRLMMNLHTQLYDYNNIPFVAAKNDALQDSMQYLYTHMNPKKILFTYDRISNLITSLKKITIDGLVLECGVFKGESINIIAKELPSNTIYGFDSFEGLPEDWAGYNLEKGYFSLGGMLPEVCDNVQLVKGFFANTLPVFAKDHTENIAFLHVDSDLYSSAVDIFNILGQKIVPGTVILFDEYFNYPNWRDGEFKAWQDFCKKEKIVYDYLSVGHQQVSVKVCKRG